MHQLQFLFADDGRGTRPCQHALNRTNHQSEWGSEFVAHIRKEDGFRAIQFREHFGTPGFFFVFLRESRSPDAGFEATPTTNITTRIGAIHFKDMSAAYGGNALGAGANVRFDASHTGWVTVQAYVHNNKTYFNLQSELTKPAISSAENGQMKALVTSYVSD